MGAPMLREFHTPEGQRIVLDMLQVAFAVETTINGKRTQDRIVVGMKAGYELTLAITYTDFYRLWAQYKGVPS